MKKQKNVRARREGNFGRDVGQGILLAYFAVMGLVFPLYYTEGYRNIGNDKFLLFRNMTMVTLGILAAVWILSYITGKGWKKGLSIGQALSGLSVTDRFAYGYFLAVLLSYLCTPYREDAIWGAEGWYMGLVTQLFFLMLYYVFSRSFFWTEKYLAIWCAGAAVVFLLGILNRYSVYPLAMEGQMTTFISTLGNINWYSGYVSVMCPMGVLLFWNSEKTRDKILSGGFCVLAFLTTVTQGSSSGILALLVLFYLLFLMAFESNARARTFLVLCILFGTGCQLGRLMRYLPGLTCNYESAVGELLTDTGLTLGVALLAAGFCTALCMAEKKKAFRIETYRPFGRGLAGIALGIVALYLIVTGINTLCPGGLPLIGDNRLFILSEEWGNARGATWRAGAEAYASMDLLHKLVGIGPDCFAQYCYDTPEIAERLWEDFANERLTNAHNEWLTILVTTGLGGMVCYGGIFVSAFVRLLRKAKKETVLCAVCICVYTIHNMVSFQQVLSTPFAFILLGMGEVVLRGEHTVFKESTPEKTTSRKSGGADRTRTQRGKKH